MPWVLPPLSNGWIIIVIWLYIALNRTPNIDCYWVGAVPKVCLTFPVISALLHLGQGFRLRVDGQSLSA